MNWKEIDNNAKQWIKEAGERIKEALSRHVDISTKANRNDLVTNVDRETEQYFIEKIRTQYPHHHILGEEGFGDEITSEAGVIWIIDPIDGTMNFVHQKRNFMISVGIYENGVGQLAYIYDCIRDELFYAKKDGGVFLNGEQLTPFEEGKIEDALLGMNAIWVTKNKRFDQNKLEPLVRAVRGTRGYGSAALEMAYVTAGWLDAYISLNLSPWDFAAGKIMVEELGGIATTCSGEPLSILKPSSVLIARPGIHETILNNYLLKD